MRKSLVLVLGLLAVAAVGWTGEVKDAVISFKFDVDSSSLTYNKMVGNSDDPWAGPMQGRGTLKTTGSSTNITENVTGANPFTDVAVGDVIFTRSVGSPFAEVALVVVTRTDAANIVVDTAVDLTGGFTWRWLRKLGGTAVTDGWIGVDGYDAVALTIQYDQGDLDALRVRWECKTAAIGAQPVIVYPGESSDCGLGGTLSTDRCSFATAGVTARLTVEVAPNPFSACRIGVAYAATDTSDAGANLEQVTGSITVTKAVP